MDEHFEKLFNSIPERTTTVKEENLDDILKEVNDILYDDFRILIGVLNLDASFEYTSANVFDRILNIKDSNIYNAVLLHYHQMISNFCEVLHKNGHIIFTYTIKNDCIGIILC